MKVEGVEGLFAGFVPRTIWMGLGGFVFFGAYECAKYVINNPSAILSTLNSWKNADNSDSRTNSESEEQPAKQRNYNIFSVLGAYWSSEALPIDLLFGETKKKTYEEIMEDRLKAEEEKLQRIALYRGRSVS